MLANYEKRIFKADDDVWIKKFKNLNNMLHWHLEPEIVYIFEGTAELFINGKTYYATQNQTFFIESGCVHYIKSSNSIIITCQAKLKLYDKLLAYSLHNPQLSRVYQIEQLYDKIIKYSSQTGLFNKHSISACLQELAYNIFSNEKIMPKDKQNNLYIENIKNILQYIDNNLEFVTFDDITNKFGYSKGYFSRLFAKLTGTNFRDYLNISRVQQSIILIKNGDAKIIDIATSCGFNSMRHFNRVFKQITNFTPTSLPQNFVLETITTKYTQTFDPTLKQSEPLDP